MISLLAAACFFVGIHLFISGTPLRDAIVARIGEQPYLGLFSLASLAGIVWLCMAYGNATPSHLYPEVPALRGDDVAVSCPVSGLCSVSNMSRLP